MQVAATRQDVQNIIDQARNRVLERLINKHEVRGAVDNARDKIFNYMYELEQQNLRIGAVQHEQQWRKLVVVENRLRSVESELTTLNQLLTQLLNQQNQIAGYTKRLTSNGNDSIAILQRALQQ